MKTLKIYSKRKPIKVNNLSPMIVESYTLSSQGTKIEIEWYTEIKTDDYFSTRIQLEGQGFIAYPSSSKEINDSIYTVFRETDNV
jgi:hypothetical protein